MIKAGELGKTIFDFTLTFIGTICISPLLAYIAYRIKKEDPGPVIFKHMRVGKNGKSFPCYKFRSMCVDAKQMLEKYLRENPEARMEWERDFKLKNDPRVTPIGEFLRRTSLDELPQIFNVLKGEMSLVGPRPIVQEEVPRYGIHIKKYYSVKPGITGLWQVSGRSDISYSERVALDVEYVVNRNLLKDIQILIKTFDVVFRKKGAYLDELPQIFNAIKGEMSLVGSRTYLDRKMGDAVNTIILAKSGITGYWQVNRHSNVIFENRLIMDCWYIGNWSFWLDLVLLLKTIGIVLDKKGAK